MQKRTILHCDCNSFFASVELSRMPEYRELPVAVCGDERERRGIVLAKNDHAKRYGIQTAETVFSAKKKCPNLIIIPPHDEEYERYSRAVLEILYSYTDLVEPFGIDESWLDVTASEKLFGSGEKIANDIRERVKRELGITVSVGVSFNKVFAKLGSDYKKPDAVTVISPENFKSIVYPLPASSLLFVGRQTEEVLTSLGIRTIGELAEATEGILQMRLGKIGPMLRRYARGEDDSPVVAEAENSKSISNGFTFPKNLVGFHECRQGIEFLTESIGTKLRRDGLKCTEVRLGIKDELLRTVGRQMKISPPTDINREISAYAYRLLTGMWTEAKPVRALTVSVGGLVHARDVSEQMSFFEDVKKTNERKKESHREVAIDAIRERYGNASIMTASAISDENGIFSKK